MIYIELFITFLKIGAFSFGGGYAMISILQQEALKNNWLTLFEFTDIVAISQITPGPLAVNMATFVGYRQAQVSGALVATLGVSIPSLIIVIIISRFLFKFNEHKTVKGLFFGLRPTVCGLILAAAIQIAMIEFFPVESLTLNIENIKSIAIFATALIGIYKLKIKPITIIIISAIAGLSLFSI